MTDLAKLAAGLTEAQKRAILWRPGYGADFGTIYAKHSTMPVLVRLGLIRNYSGGWAYLSELGHQVASVRARGVISGV